MLSFCKMEALGNDFVVFDSRQQKLSLSAEQIVSLADRRRGIGCDQVLLLEATSEASAVARYRVFNADGSAAGECGNGLRCLALLLQQQGEQAPFVIATASKRLISCQLAPQGYRLAMGKPVFTPQDIPLCAPIAAHYHWQQDTEELCFSALSMGNPHAVVVVPDVAAAPLARWGKILSASSLFPDRVNLGVMEIVDQQHIRLRVFERGVGETLACGTAACAAMVAGRRDGLLADSVAVSLPGGVLQIDWRGAAEDAVFMAGPATLVYRGEIAL